MESSTEPVVTAVSGGHIGSLPASNKVIRDIVEARNRARADGEGSGCCDGGRCHSPLPSIQTIGDAMELAFIPERQPSKPDADNPKDIVGTNKLPLHLWPTTATAMGCIALLNGALKYGRSNWREVGVRASIYVDACQRHLAAWFEGNEHDEEGVPHLSAALACLAILVDCQAAGKLRDDRQYPGGHAEFLESLTPHVAMLRERHADKSPKHYTIKDAEAQG